MTKNSPLSILIILIIAGMAVWYLYPSINFYFIQPPERREVIKREDPGILKKLINLGLDLQGGMRLVLEIDRSKLKEKEISQLFRYL